MSRDDHILVSLEPRHAESILAGRKDVELRRRTMNVAPGSTMWIYVKRPVGSIVGNAIVGKVASSTPTVLWRTYGAVSGLSKREFFNYFDGIKRGVALVLGERLRFDVTLSLEALREMDQGFHPPQFFARLPATHPLRNAMTETASTSRLKKGLSTPRVSNLSGIAEPTY